MAQYTASFCALVALITLYGAAGFAPARLRASTAIRHVSTFAGSMPLAPAAPAARSSGPSAIQIHQSASSSEASSSSSDMDGSSGGGYTRQGDDPIGTKREAPYPKISDVVSFYDVDGGQADGQALVGKISLIQPILSAPSTSDDGDDNDDGTNKWLVEITELEDVGDGYYAEYPSRKRRNKRALRNLEDVAPVAASFVRTEDAYKVPTDRGTGRPVPLFPQYKLVGYGGPAAVPINEDVVQSDLERYGDLKIKLLRDALLAGLAGALVTDLVRGLDDAIVYFSGALAGVGYLFFLSIKTDTIGSSGGKLGKDVSNFRFVLPAIVLVGIAIRNVALGDASPLGPGGPTNILSTVTKEQFACAMIGFLTYRIPLFIGQLAPVFGDSAGSLLPGSAGMAFQMAQEAKAASEAGTADATESSLFGKDLTPVLLVCGPPSSGTTSLVQKLIEEDDRFVPPKLVDRLKDPATFERLESREEFLTTEDSGRYGLTAEGVLSAASEAEVAAEAAATEAGTEQDEVESTEKQGKVVVVDANVDLAKKLRQLPGARLIGVWVGLDSMEKFESNIKAQIESGDLSIPEGETEESVIRAKVKEIVQNIEYGVVSGMFEFTILNNDMETSMAELKRAAEYAFK
mmetsp:Transcript_38488/g.83603  ORF Transcript_38488/g.83603 Transcript_38488/m.83603 type:complete len:631 (+) Transcript_38488:64-1956(+)